MLAQMNHSRVSANVPLPGAGMPQERLAQIAARRVFVDLKLRFANAVTGIPGDRGHWLRRQVRCADEPGDLWLLRGAVFSALRELGTQQSRLARHDLHAALGSVFPESEELMPLL